MNVFINVWSGFTYYFFGSVVLYGDSNCPRVSKTDCSTNTRNLLRPERTCFTQCQAVTVVSPGYCWCLWTFTSVWPKSATGGNSYLHFAYHFDIVAITSFLNSWAFLWPNLCWKNVQPLPKSPSRSFSVTTLRRHTAQKWSRPKPISTKSTFITWMKKVIIFSSFLWLSVNTRVRDCYGVETLLLR